MPRSVCSNVASNASYESRETRDASGVSTRRVRAQSLALCAVLCGLAGAFLSLGYLQLFGENMSNGRGWIALAAIVLVQGSPFGIAMLSLLFGVAASVGLKAQSLNVPAQFTEMLPYLATLVALFVYARRRRLRSTQKPRQVSAATPPPVTSVG